MKCSIRRLFSSAALAVLTVLLVLVAKLCKSAFFAVYPKVSRALIGVLAEITSVVPFAVWELVAAGLILWFFVSLFLAVFRGRIIKWLTGVLLAAMIAAFWFVSVWGLNYFAPKMNERLGLSDTQYDVRQLREVTEYFRDRANETAETVERDENGVMLAGDFDDLAVRAGDGYRTLAENMECFDGSTARVKRLLTSKLLGKTGTSGIFLAFTGESGVCSTTFSASVPYTMCHEIGHRMAFAREDEANFAAFLACMENGRDDFVYSGYYSAYIYCINALNRADPNAAAEVSKGVGKLLHADLSAATAHYRAVEDETAVKIQTKVYENYLKTFEVKSGVQSYGEVVDLLALWYFERIR